ncbi:MAG: hypothetical protein M1814_001820 [Vezdaea aestivalis]|nr:MAG: hypothetical protein M1814_001820 [Vezdaea aestivalis]
MSGPQSFQIPPRSSSLRTPTKKELRAMFPTEDSALEAIADAELLLPVHRKSREDMSKIADMNFVYGAKYANLQLMAAKKSMEILDLRNFFSHARLDVRHIQEAEWIEENEALDDEKAIGERLIELYGNRLKRLRNDSDLDIELEKKLELVSKISAHPGILGLGSTRDGGEGPRDSRVQSKWKDQVIARYDAVKPEGYGEGRLLWDPIFGEWVLDHTVKAAHVIGRANGSRTMRWFVGDDPEYPEQIWSPRNGLILSFQMEELFDKFAICIVPYVNDPRNQSECRTWLQSNPREYKVIIIDDKVRKLENFNNKGDGEYKYIGDLDNKKLIFRNDNRPRARHLYVHYALAILRLRVKMQQSKDQAGKRELANQINDHEGYIMWATPGKWLRPSAANALARGLGHSALLDEESETEDDRFKTFEEIDKGEETDLNPEPVDIVGRWYQAIIDQGVGKTSMEDEEYHGHTDELESS